MGRRRKLNKYEEGLVLIYTFFFIMGVAGKGVEDLVNYLVKKDPQKAKKIVEEFCKCVKKEGEKR